MVSFAGGRQEMGRKIVIVLSVAILLLLSNLAFADCVDLGGFTSWVAEDTHTVVFYMGKRPIARLQISDCTIRPSSSVRLIKSYVCDSDSIEIDGKECSLITVQVLY
jgi:hypothetical protein